MEFIIIFIYLNALFVEEDFINRFFLKIKEFCFNL